MPVPKTIRRLFTLLLPALLALGCKTGGASKAGPDAAPGSVIMKVNGEPVNQRELDLITEAVIAEAPPDITARIETLRPRIREKAREELIMRKILDQAMVREQIVPSDERVEAEIQAIDEFLKARALTLDQYIREANTTPEAVRAEVREKLSFEMLYDKLLALEPPSDGEARAYYEKNLARYSRPRAAQMREILRLFPEKREPTRAEVSEVMAQMEAYSRRLETGEDFATLARRVSQGPTAEQGGDMGWIFPDSQLPQPVIEAAFTQEVGRTGHVVQTIFGLHLFLVTERREAQQLPFDQVQGVVIADMQRERRTKQVPGLLKRLRRQAKVENPPFSEPAAPAVEVAPAAEAAPAAP